MDSGMVGLAMARRSANFRLPVSSVMHHFIHVASCDLGHGLETDQWRIYKCTNGIFHILRVCGVAATVNYWLTQLANLYMSKSIYFSNGFYN